MLFRMSSFQRPYVFHFAINFTLGKLNDVMDLFSTLTAHYHLHFITKLQIKYCLCWETIPTQPCYMTYSVFFLYSFDFFFSLEIKKIKFMFYCHISSFGGLHPEKTTVLILSLLFSQIIKYNERWEDEPIKMIGMRSLGHSVNLMFLSP